VTRCCPAPNSYFGSADGGQAPSPIDADRWKRYGIKIKPSERLWETFDPRFDPTKTPNEVNRFGYVVELNPWDPHSTPVKHTAMGRFKHEAATIYVTPDGTVVAYSGDDERFDYMYKFVSAKKIQPGRDAAAMAHNMTLLDEGTLYVAKLTTDIPADQIDGSGTLPAGGAFRGAGTWIPLLRSGADGTRDVGRRDDTAGGRGVHPVRRRQIRCHQDGPPRRLRGQPAQRQALRRSDQQRRAGSGG
jgi:secreted PhoX family phosphatase